MRKVLHKVLVDSNFDGQGKSYFILFLYYFFTEEWKLLNMFSD